MRRPNSTSRLATAAASSFACPFFAMRRCYMGPVAADRTGPGLLRFSLRRPLSPPRKRGPGQAVCRLPWIPALAGMTNWCLLSMPKQSEKGCMKEINVLAIQRTRRAARARIEAIDPAVRFIDAGGWIDGEYRETWSAYAASRYVAPNSTGSGT